MGDHDALTAAEPRALAERIEGRCIERALEWVDYRAGVDLLHLYAPAKRRKYGIEIRSTKSHKVH